MLRWLHISDLHIKKKADWTNFKTELFRKCKEIGKIDFVIVTGDFHDYSEGESFEKAEEFLQSLMDELCLNIEKDLFLIPGNHDGTSDIKFRGTCIKAAKGDPLNFEPDCLEQLLSMFGNYDNFVKKLNANYPVDQPSTVHLRVWNHQLALIHCNTALAADGREKEDQILDIDSLSEIKVSPGLPIFLLAHNSFYDLNEQQQDRVKDYIRNNNVCAYLCGDTHVDDVRQISFGSNQNQQIPCIISYKSAPDPKDSYSRFGMIIGEWEKEYAELKGWIWLSGEGFKPDGTIYEKKINMRGLPVPSAVPSIDCDIQFSEEWKLIDKSVEEQKSKNLKNRMKQFLRGFPCTWALAFSDLPVARKQFDSLKLKIQEGGIVALLGAGAEGKSTLLMQLSAQLYREGHVVLFYIKKVGRRKYQLPEQLPDNAVLVVDDPDDYNFIKLVYQVYEDGYTLLFAARHNEWNLLCDRYDVSADMNRMITFEYMNNVTDSEEAGAFADRVMQYYRPDADRDEMIEIFLHNSGEYGFLYAAMLLAIYDKEKFEEIAKDIIRYIGDDDPKYLQLLGYAVLSEQAGAFFTEYQYQSLLKQLSLKSRDAKSALELELQHKKGRWETRHPQISRLFYEKIFNENVYFEDANIDGMKYDLLDVALNEYTKNGPSIVKKSLMENIISLASFMDEVQEPQPMIQRVVEELRNNIIVLQKISAQILKEETYCAFAEKCYSVHVIDFSIMLRWAKSQQTLQGAGDYGQENSALWIYQEACMNQEKMASSVWLGWAQLEKETHGVGGYTKENSALWIYREACINRKVSGNDIWLDWAQLEKEVHGVGDYGKENSALWIYREACINRKIVDSGVWLGWVQLEREAHGVGDYGKENSALWLYREACTNRKVPGSNIWLGWAKLEREAHGVGDYGKENSALWLYREACINRKVPGSDIWLGWVKLEKEAHGAGDYGQENSALWLYHEACINQNFTGSDIWLSWAKDSVLHSEGEWTKLKILKHALNVTHREVKIVSEYANCLMHNNYFEEARKEYRKESNKNYILSSLLIIEMVAGNISGQDEFSTTELIPRIKSAVAYSNAARYSLYLYYQFMGDKEEADVYYAMLDLVLDEVKNIAKRLDDFLNDCLRAHQHPAEFV